MTNTNDREFLVFGSPYIGEEEIREVVDSLRSCWLGTGPKVARFERDFAAYKGVSEKNVAAVNSCTAALHISMIAAGIGPGDEVITTPLTFAATVNAIIHSGATPVLADVDPKTMNIDPAQVEQRITPKTRALVIVHLGGTALRDGCAASHRAQAPPHPDRRLRPCHRNRVPRAQGGDLRRVRLLQLLCDQERRHR